MTTTSPEAPMYHDSRLAPASRRLLPYHLELLAAALGRLGGQARAEFSLTLAEAAARLVGDAVSAALAAPAPHAPHGPWHRPERGAPLVDVLDDPAMEYDDDPTYGWEDDGVYRPQGRTEVSMESDTESWPAGLALGLRVAAWWLVRRSGQPALLPALAVGIATTLAALAGGPLALAGLGLVEAVLSLAAAEGATRLAAGFLTSPRH